MYKVKLQAEMKANYHLPIIEFSSILTSPRFELLCLVDEIKISRPIISGAGVGGLSLVPGYYGYHNVQAQISN